MPEVETFMVPKILIIDDDAALRNVMVSTFSRLGYDVRSAGNGVEGLALFNFEPADLVITDLIMPEGEGIEAILKLGETPQPPKIIAISGGYASFDVLQLARSAGAHATALKPVRMSRLVGLAQELLDGADRAAA